MVKNHNLAKHISDCGWNNLIQYCTYKAEIAGSMVEQVNPNGTSQICSSCGITVKKDLSVRIHNCPNCKTVLDRDLNASINIKNRSSQKNTVGSTGIYAYGDCVIPMMSTSLPSLVMPNKSKGCRKSSCGVP